MKKFLCIVFSTIFFTFFAKKVDISYFPKEVFWQNKVFYVAQGDDMKKVSGFNFMEASLVIPKEERAIYLIKDLESGKFYLKVSYHMDPSKKGNSNIKGPGGILYKFYEVDPNKPATFANVFLKVENPERIKKLADLIGKYEKKIKKQTWKENI